MEGKREHPLTAGFIYEIEGLNVLVIPAREHRGTWAFHDLHLDVHGKVFCGASSVYQPDEDGRILRDGQPTGKTLEDLEFVSEGDFPSWDPVPSDS